MAQNEPKCVFTSNFTNPKKSNVIRRKKVSSSEGKIIEII